jgi:hypothetical protein
MISLPTPLEDDLARLLEARVPSIRDCRLVRRVLGWDGQRGCCLKDAGEEFGITRERARQIYDEAIAQMRAGEVSRSLDAVLAFVHRMGNRAADEVEAELQRRGFTRWHFPARGLLKTAGIFRRASGFAVEETGGKLFVVASAGVVRSIIKAALRSTAQQGVQTIGALCSALPRQHRRNDAHFIRQVLNTRSDIRWLDTAQETFWLASVPRNPMVRSLEKVLSYVSPVSLSDLQRALGRLPAKRRTNLTRRVLMNFCNQVPLCRVTQGYVEPVTPLSGSNLISDAERLVCGILSHNGGALSLERLQSMCDMAGVGRPNFWRIVLHSPLIFRRAPKFYGVISAKSRPIDAVHERTA